VAATVRENLFPGALPHVDRHVGELLEERSNVPWSSQALCISVFGAIAESPARAELMQQTLTAAGVSVQPEGDPELLCEVRGRRDVLNEIGGSNATCPDVLVEWPSLTLTIESKFTEHLSPCGQIDLRQRQGRTEIRPKKCSGNHELGSDLRTRTDAACRLTVPENEGRRGYRSERWYWKVGAGLFRQDVLAPPRSPCPFADGKYQLMRNLCFAAALAAKHSSRHDFAFVLAYVGQAKSASGSEADFAAFHEMLLPEAAARTGAITYEKIAAMLKENGQGELAEWVDERLRAGVVAGR
jgi:hypothetical protein